MAHEPDEGRCSCGATRFAVRGRPLLRFHCHCTICQAYNGAPWGDVVVYRAADVEILDDSQVAYRAHKRPPILLRGTCTRCGGAALEKPSLSLPPRLTLVPRQTLGAEAELPGPALHIFYRSRRQDVDDDRPKYNGYLASQSALALALLRGAPSR